MRDYGKGDALTEVTYLVLLSFYTPNHGYGSIQLIEQQTEGRIKLGAGTLYGSLKSLLKHEWISFLREENNKKVYVITQEGKAVLQKEITRLHRVCEIGMTIMSEKGDICGKE